MTTGNITMEVDSALVININLADHVLKFGLGGFCPRRCVAVPGSLVMIRFWFTYPSQLSAHRVR